LRLAWFSPLPPLASGIADYSYELLPLIAERADVQVVCPRPAGRARRRLRIPPGTSAITPESFREGRDADAVFYHLGNNPLHEFVYDAALERPGIAVFHDLVLHHLIHHITREIRPDHDRYEALLRVEYGEAGLRLAHLRERGMATEFEKFLFPLTAHVARRAKTIVVHSHEARDQMEEVAPGVPVSVIPHHAGSPPPKVESVTRQAARRRLRLPADAFLVGHMGFVTIPKQPAALVAGFARLAQDRPNALLLVVGADHSGGLFQRLIEHHDLEARIRQIGYVDLEMLYLYLKAVDAVINLRYPSAGESSGTVARTLAEGRALIVTNVGSFAEIPEDAALKVEIDGDLADQVGDHLIRLSRDGALRESIEGHAREYAAAVLDPSRCRDLYLDAAAVAIGRDGVAAQAGQASPGLATISGGSDPRDPALAMATWKERLPSLEQFAAESLPPAGAALELDLLYRFLLGRPAEDQALRRAQLSLAAGEETRSDLIRSIVESREFREVELIEGLLRRVRLDGTPFSLPEGAAVGPGTTERVVEIPWVLTRWSGERRVLDMGYAFASGFYLTALLGLPIEDLHGVDWAAASVPGMLRTRADLRALPYREGSFDLVICISTIGHVGKDALRYGTTAGPAEGNGAQSLREIERVLKPGGKLLVTVPFGRAEDHGWFAQYDGARWEALVGAAPLLRPLEREVFHLTEEGWERTDDLETLERISYGWSAPAARGVLCASLGKVGGLL
jgi:glycosyltransferase involved in cell wall biosynthesis/SAM-dependent methyltransferase